MESWFQTTFLYRLFIFNAVYFRMSTSLTNKTKGKL
nr:MAG TPA: hypothetical protein [Caudoviricetes sp.]